MAAVAAVATEALAVMPVLTMELVAAAAMEPKAAIPATMAAVAAVAMAVMAATQRILVAVAAAMA